MKGELTAWVAILERVLDRTARAPSSSGSGSGGTINRYPVTVNIAGRRASTINVESAADQAALTGLLQDLGTTTKRRQRPSRGRSSTYSRSPRVALARRRAAPRCGLRWRRRGSSRSR